MNEKHCRTKGQRGRPADVLDRQKAVRNVRCRVGDSRVDGARQPGEEDLGEFVHRNTDCFTNIEALARSLSSFIH